MRPYLPDVARASTERLAAEAVLAYAYSGGDRGKWPLTAERPILTAINTWTALREHDRDALKRAANWRDSRHQYRIDPLAERISDSWAAYLAGEDAMIGFGEGASLEDVAKLDYLLDQANDLDAELERLAGLTSSEGEYWARIFVDELAAPAPQVELVSRTNVLPYWIGARLAGAAIITDLPPRPGAAKGEVARHLEVHVPGLVLNALYVGRENELGDRSTLEWHPSTAGLVEEWAHGLAGMLVIRVPNRIRRRPQIGVSDYAGIYDYLLDLNEICATGAHNAALTARKRFVMSQAAAQQQASGTVGDLADDSNASNALTGIPRARFDAREEGFVEDPIDGELGREARDPFRIIEYAFDATALVDWKRELVESAVNRAGLVGQYVGANTAADGYAISGTALRLRLIPTDAAGRAKARYLNKAVPKIVGAMVAVDNLSKELRGYGRGYSTAVLAGTVEYLRRPGIPVDAVEEAQRHASLRGAGLLSVETSLRERYPDKDETWYVDEVDRIRADGAAGASSFMP